MSALGPAELSVLIARLSGIAEETGSGGVR